MINNNSSYTLIDNVIQSFGIKLQALYRSNSHPTVPSKNYHKHAIV